MRHRGPIPGRIDLGLHSINVRFVGKREMREESEHDEEEGTELPTGLWCPEEEEILLARWTNRMRQRWDLLHEMGHACLDLRDYYDRKV